MQYKKKIISNYPINTISTELKNYISEETGLNDCISSQKLKFILLQNYLRYSLKKKYL